MKHCCLILVLALSAAFCMAEQSAPSGMALISAGLFRPFYVAQPGSNEIPVKPFYLDKLPVTNEDFLSFVREHPKWRRSQVKRLFADDSYLKNWADDLDLGANALPSAPVTFVSWFAAKAYAKSHGKRLPAIAEWERAASASSTQPDGSSDPQFARQILVWYSRPGGQTLRPVGGGSPNYWGIHDLHGLVWEWVADFNSVMASGDARNDGLPDLQRFCGTGSQGVSNPENYPAFMRYAFRSSLKADYCVNHLGFRCAKDL
jgi:formylglycine-generating enzyme required for sulfatase activity